MGAYVLFCPILYDPFKLEWLQAKAEAGNLWAQKELGKAYDKGLSTINLFNDYKDVTLSAKYYEMAANQGDKEAQEALAQLKAVNASEEKKENRTVTNMVYQSALGKLIYTGPVDDDQLPHGVGVGEFSDGRYYKGNFSHGVMTGDNVVFRYANGDEFTGSFRQNTFSKGKYTRKESGSYFEGTFKDGKADKGLWYDKDGNKLD
jgi:hypothetical protein